MIYITKQFRYLSESPQFAWLLLVWVAKDLLFNFQVDSPIPIGSTFVRNHNTNCFHTGIETFIEIGGHVIVLERQRPRMFLYEILKPAGNMTVQQWHLEMTLDLPKAGNLLFKLSVVQTSTSNNWREQLILGNNATHSKSWMFDRNGITLAHVRQLSTTYYYNNHIHLEDK